MKDDNTSLFAILRDHRSIPHLSSDELKRELLFVRSQNDEVYKVLTTPVISNILYKLINQTTPKIQRCKIFDAPEVPEISISEYMDRIIRYTPCSAEVYIMAVILMDRLAMGAGVHITHLNVHRLLFTSILVASKTLDDTTYNNKYHSIVGGLELQDLNTLERRFLNLINYNLNVSFENFEFYRREIELNCISLEEPHNDIFYESRENTYEPPSNENNKRYQIRRTRSLSRSSADCSVKNRRRSRSITSSQAAHPVAA